VKITLACPNCSEHPVELACGRNVFSCPEGYIGERSGVSACWLFPIPPRLRLYLVSYAEMEECDCRKGCLLPEARSRRHMVPGDVRSALVLATSPAAARRILKAKEFKAHQSERARFVSAREVAEDEWDGGDQNPWGPFSEKGGMADSEWVEVVVDPSRWRGPSVGDPPPNAVLCSAPIGERAWDANAGYFLAYSSSDARALRSLK
jgi:hypothetical protein